MADRPRRSGRSIYVAQGEIAVDDHPDTVIGTLLGSCVSVCLYDPLAGVGGMNHILLPDDPAGGADGRGVALHGMEILVNPLMRLGAQRSRLQAKVFGGACFSGMFGDIGSRNVEFVMTFLAEEGIRCVGQSVGGRSARRVKFWPASGRAQQKLVSEEPDEAPVALPKSGGLELF